MNEKKALGKYFIAGIVAAIIIFVIVKLTEETVVDPKQVQKKMYWAPETDSQFVKDCYGKYKSQVKDNPQLAENLRVFCRCMLDKIQTKYSETQMEHVSNDDIKKWDTECRNEIKSPVFKQDNSNQTK